MNFIPLLIGLLFSAAFAQEMILKKPQGGDFSIPSTEGQLSSKSLLGKHVFLFFGFSNCPDVCPLTLRRMKQLAGKLEKSERENFRFLFISVDNERDTIEKLKTLKKTYGDSYIGAVDKDENLTKIATLFGARYRRLRNVKNQMIVDHTDSIFHIDPKGKWVETLPYGSSVESMMAALKKVRVYDPAEHPERTAKLLKKNTDCDLGKAACTIQVNGDEFTLSLSPYPIKTERNFSIKVTAKSKTLTPHEVDFQGVELNMGYIRPSLTRKAETNYESNSLALPICELSRMEWVVRLIVAEKSGKLHFLDYKLITLE